jgi:hypothetical protein
LRTDAELTVVVRADVQHASLTASNSLRQAEESRSEGRNTLRRELLGSVQRGTGGGDLDAVAVPANASTSELLVVQTGVVEGELGVVCLGRQGLEEDATADHVDVLLAHEDSL